MKVRVIAFATASDVLGRTPVEIDLPENSRLADLEREILARYPALEPLWPRLAVAVDGELSTTDRELTDGAEVALLPPVSGGSGPPPRAALVDGPIDMAAVERRVADPACGAVLLFLGTVRDHHAGRAVAGLTYSAYRTMAEKVLGRIAGELEAAGDRLRVAIVHRLGEVPVGEASVVIAVASPHREAAYEASRSALERLKHEVPIWKRERYADGETAWREEEPLASPSSGKAGWVSIHSRNPASSAAQSRSR
ncbi:MAG: molybdenum cofactor biosynthesis protein MoaE [Thermoanaerobaculia bacterium]